MATNANNKTTQSGNKDKGSNAGASGNKPANKRDNNNRNRNKNRGAKPRKKPTFIGLNHDKVKAVVADEPGLDPLSTQLVEKLVKGRDIVRTSVDDSIHCYINQNTQVRNIGYCART